MNAMQLVNALGYIDEDLVFDAADGGETALPESGTGKIKTPKQNKPPRGGAKTKAIIIGVVAVILAVAVTFTVLYFTGVFTPKQTPVYQGMYISSVPDSSADSSVSAVSYKYSGDYKGKDSGVDGSNPFGAGALESQVASTLKVTGAGESIYYADAGDDIYITIKFSNPDYFDIISFVLSDGTVDTPYTSYMFETGSDYENVIIKLNVGTAAGITDYTISQIKYIDGTTIKDVEIQGDTVVSCGVRAADGTTVTATVAGETTTLTSISFTVNLTDKYSLIAYNDGEATAVLYDGESIVQTAELKLGSNAVEFTDLSPDTLYQYAIVAYYDDLSGTGVALNYLYTNAVYTSAVVLFDGIEIGQESITFDYSWYQDYGNQQITSLVLTGGSEITTLDPSAKSATGLLSDTDYTLIAYYVGINGESASITLEFTTEAKTAPEVELDVTENTQTSATFTVGVTDESGICTVTSIGVYEGETLLQSYETSSTEITYSSIESGKLYTLKYVYEYNLNDGSETVQVVKAISFNSEFVFGVDNFAVVNTSAVTSGDYVMFSADIYNPSNVTITQAVINGETYDVLSSSTYTKIYVSIPTSGLETGRTTFTLSQINCTYSDVTYAIDVSANNTADVYIYSGELAEITIESVELYYYKNGEYVAIGDNLDVYSGDYTELRIKINLYNPANYVVTSAYIEFTVNAASSGMECEITSATADYQTIYISHIGFGTNVWSEQIYGEGVVTVIVGSLTYTNGTKSTTTTFDYDAGTFCSLGSSEVVEIYTAEDLLAISYMEETDGLQISTYRYYKLMNDIDLSGYNWTNSNILGGIFDGNGYTIKNMTYTAECKSGDIIYNGLFGGINGIVINLTMTGINCTINNVTDESYINVGVLAGEVYSVLRVYNCSFSGSITLINASTGYFSTQLDVVGSATEYTHYDSVGLYNTYVICNGEEEYYDEKGQLSE